MTIDRRIVRTLRDVRGKLRDLAQAEHATTSASQKRCEQAVARAKTDLEGMIAAAGDQLRTAASVAELDRISQAAAAHHVCIDEAANELAAAVVMVEESGAQLRQRAQQVVSAERLFDRVQRESAVRVNRREQRSHDDLRRRGIRETKR